MALFHTLFILLVVGPLALGLYGFFKYRKTEPPAANAPLLYLTLNSAVLYALAYNLIFFLQELALALGKKGLGLTAYLYHNNHGWDGDHPMTDLAQGYGALAIFISGILFGAVFWKMKNSKGWVTLGLLWLSFHGFAQSLPQIFTAMVAPETDVAVALNYLGVGDASLTFLVAMSFFGIVFISLSFSRLLLGMSEKEEVVSTAKGRFRILFHVAFLAALIGLVLTVPFRIPPFQQVFAPVVVTLFSIPWVFANAWRVKNVQPIGSEANGRVLFVPIILLVLFLLFFQCVLADGVRF